MNTAPNKTESKNEATKIYTRLNYLNKCVFKRRLKTGTDPASLSCNGNSFQSHGAATTKEWSPALFTERGTLSFVISVEERSLGLFSAAGVSLNKVIRSHKSHLLSIRTFTSN